MSVWRRHRAELRLSVRMTVAGVAAFALAQLLGLPQAYWAVLTAIIVMQANVGASLEATLDRLVATLGGAVWGVAVASITAHTGLAALALTVTLAPMALVGALRPAYRVAAITATIVLLSARTQQVGALRSAVDRVLDIGLGGGVALAVALLVLPTRARALLAETAGDALELLAQDVVALLEGRSATPEALAIPALPDRIRAAVARVEAAAKEAARERGHWLTDAPDSEPLVRTLRRLRHDLTMVSRAVAEPLPAPVRSALETPAARAGVDIAAFLRGAARALAARVRPPSLAAVGQALAAYDTAMAEVRRRGLTHDLPGDTVGRLFGLAFALEQLGRDLGELADRVRQLARRPAAREEART